MKKLLLILLCVPLMFSCGSNEKDNTDLTRANIKGNVKEIIETTFDAKEAFDEPQKGDLRTKDISKYDEDGNLTEMTVYNADGEITNKYKYEFDKDGNKTETTFYNADGEMTSKWKYEFYKDGNMTETTVYNADGEITNKYKYEFDKDGNKTETTFYNADGEMTNKWKGQYDKFDKIKNWIVRTEYINDILKNIKEREIEYYE